MDSNATVREATNNAAETVREYGAQKTVRESASTSLAHASIGFQAFRDYNIVEQLTSSGAESDIYVVSKDTDKFILKLYRFGIKPKIEVINKIASLSKTSPRELIHIFEFDFDEGTKRWFEIQEYAEHGSLKKLIDDIPKLGEKGRDALFLSILRQVSDSLKLLHENEILHLDLKPANVLVRSLKPIDFVLIDFGISNSLDSEVSKKFTAVRGTPMYQSPESWSGAIGKPSDWWSLGMLAFEIANGKHPFEGLSQQVIASLLMTKSIEIPESIPQDKREILHGLLTRDMSNRWDYDQVSRWLGGERNIPVFFEKPAAENAPSAEKQIHNDNIGPLSFLGEKHTSLYTLARAIAADEASWAKGRELFMRGNIRTWLERNGEFEQAIDKDLLVEDTDDPDEKLFRFVHFYGKPLPFVFMGKVITINNLYIFLGKTLRREERSKAETILAEKMSDGKLSSLLDFYLQHNKSNNESDNLKQTLSRIKGETSQVIFDYLGAIADIKKDVSRQNFVNLSKVGDINEIEEAIRLGANVNATDKDGMTALMYAAYSGDNTEIITALLKAGADVNASNNSLTIWSQFKISTTIKSNVPGNRGGWTSLMYAASRNKNPRIIDALLEGGADINKKDACGITAFMYAVCDNDNPEVISALLNGGAKVKEKYGNGWTALMLTTKLKHDPKIITALVERGADVNANNNVGLTALMLAKSDPEILTILLEAGADVYAKENQGWTALMYAARENNPEALTVLLEAGADVNDKDNQGRTALMHSALFNNPEIISVLLEAGADVNVKDFGGKRAIDYAAEKKNRVGAEAYQRLQSASPAK